MKPNLLNKKNRKRFIPSLLLSPILLFATLSSCTHEEAVVGNPSEQGEKITLSTWSMTRFAEEGLFSPGDSVGIYSVKWLDNTTPDILLPAGNHRDNVPYFLEDENDNWTSPDPIYYPFGGRNIDLYAYYPYQEQMFNADTRLNVAVAADQSALEDYRKSDFKAAVARGQNASNAPIHFDFYHRLSQVTFELIAGTGVMPEELLVAEIKLKNVVKNGTYSFTGGTPDSVYTGNSVADVVPCGTWEIQEGKVVGQAAILMPQLLTSNSILEITVENTVVSAPFEEVVQLRSGESRVISITLTGQGIEFETEIKPWDEQPPMPEDPALFWFKPEKRSIKLSLTIKSDVQMNWGDGSTEKRFTAGSYTHFPYEYESAGDYIGRAYGAKGAVTYLNISPVKELGIANCPELEILDVSGSDLNTIDLSQNQEIFRLHLYADKLSELDIYNNHKLQQLKIISMTESARIPLNELNCWNNPYLRLLKFENTSISEFNSPPQIKQLWCQNNLLSELIFPENSFIDFIECDNNLLVSLDLSNCYYLYDLSCNHNQLESLDLSNQNNRLRFIDCSYNPFLNNDTERLKFIQSLPSKSYSIKGILHVDAGLVEIIQELCNTEGKYWTVKAPG